jgi:hypothetical protein
MSFRAPASEGTSTGPSSVGQRRAEVVRAAHARSPRAQARERTDRDGGERPRRQRRDRQRGQADHHHQAAQVLRPGLDRREAAQRLQAQRRGGHAERRRQRAPLGPPDLDRRETVLGRHRGRVVRNVAAALDDPAAQRDLRERARADEQALGAPPHRAAPAAAEAPPAVAVLVGVGLDARDARLEVAVDRGAAVALDGGDEQRAGDRAAERDGRHRRQRDPRPQAGRRPHVLSVQPTPRTLCRIRGSPPASSLRRR